MVKRDRSYKGTKEPELVRARQDAFIAAYGEVGSVRAACDASGVGRSTIATWQKNDAHGFRAKYATAKELFREYLQDLAVDRVKNQKPNDNPVLLITLLNAHWNEKYRRDSQGATNDTKELMAEFRKFVKDNKKSKKSDQALKVEDEAEQARLNAIDEVEKILSRRSRADDNGDEK
jgi:hypothetical protein